MLKKRIEAGRVYRDGFGLDRGPMEPRGSNLYPWVCTQTGRFYGPEGQFSPVRSVQDLVSRVKTQKADKPNAEADSKPAKVKKWRKAWVVMKDGAQAGPFYTDYPFWAQNAGDAFTIHRARVRIEQEE